MRNSSDSYGSDFHILKATEADIPAILAMIKGLAEYECLEHMLTATGNNLRETLFGPNPAAEVLMAASGSVYVGFAVYFETFSSILGRRGCFLDHLFVVPEWRGHGVGHVLMCQLAAICRERNYGRLEWMVLDWNQPAVDFYKHEGAELLTGWTKCRMDDAAIQALSPLASDAKAA